MTQLITADALALAAQSAQSANAGAHSHTQSISVSVSAVPPRHVVTWEAALVLVPSASPYSTSSSSSSPLSSSSSPSSSLPVISTAAADAARAHLRLGRRVALFLADPPAGLAFVAEQLQQAIFRTVASSGPGPVVLARPPLKVASVALHFMQRAFDALLSLLLANTSPVTHQPQHHAIQPDDALPLNPNARFSCITLQPEAAASLICCAEGVDRWHAIQPLLASLIPSLPRPSVECPFTFAVKTKFPLIAKHLLDHGTDKHVSLAVALEYCDLVTAIAVSKKYPEKIVALDAWPLRNPTQYGRCDIVQWVYEIVPKDRQHAVFLDIRNFAAAYGLYDLLTLAVDADFGRPISSAAIELAAEAGLLDSLIWIRNNTNVAATPKSIDLAARNGFINVVQWLHTHWPDLNCTHEALVQSAERGHIEVFRFLWNVYPSQRLLPSDLLYCAFNGHFGIIEFFLDAVSPPATPDAINALLGRSLAGGHLHLADWLVKVHHATPTPAMMDYIAQMGCIRAASWLHSHLGGGYSPRCIKRACEGGWIDMVKYLVQVCRVDIPRSAVEGGTPLAIVKIMFEARKHKDWVAMAPCVSEQSTRDWILNAVAVANSSHLATHTSPYTLEPWGSFEGEICVCSDEEISDLDVRSEDGSFSDFSDDDHDDASNHDDGINSDED
eukprot:jgi/Hompol1/1895/HPOL_005777-RA